MVGLDTRIQNLVNYARTQDGADRTVLFQNLIDLFLTPDAPIRAPIRAQLLDVLEALIPHVNPESRRAAAGLIGSMPQPPMDLVFCLAHDEADLVGDLLRQMPFDEDQLIDLINSTGRAHHQEIAARNNLSANVWIALARAAPNRAADGKLSNNSLFDESLGAGAQHAQHAQHEATITALHPEHVVERLDALTRDVGLGQKLDFAAPPKGPDGAETTRAPVLVPQTGQPLASPNEAASQNRVPGPETRPSERRPSEARPEANREARHDAGPADATSKPAGLPSFLKEPKDGFLPDPAPGSWAFRSNRDGFITHLSPHARDLLAHSDRALGDNLLDFFGLNQKLGHPIARAFQRRSPIHAAPLYVDDCPKGQRYWSLDACPSFSQKTGAFDGYEGSLSPVKQDQIASPADTSESALFTGPDILTPSQAPNAAASQTGAPQEQKAAAPKTDKALSDTVPASNAAGDWFDDGQDQPSSSAYVDQLARMESLSESLLSQLEAAIETGEASEPVAKQQPHTGHSDRTDGGMLGIGQTDKPAEQATIAHTNSPADIPGPAASPSGIPSGPGGPDAPDTPDTPDALVVANSVGEGLPESISSDTAVSGPREEALGMLEDVIAQIVRASKGDQTVNLRLQAEIAAACVRSLRDI